MGGTLDELRSIKRWRVWRRAVDETVSIRARSHRGFRFLLAALVCISVGSACIENGLHPLMLLLLPLMLAAIARGEYGRAYLWNEKVTLTAFMTYVAVFTAALPLVHGGLTLPVFMVYFTFGILFVRLMMPLTDRNLAQVIALTVAFILVNSILTNHIVFGLILPVYLFALMGTLLLFHVARNSPGGDRNLDLPAENWFSRTWYGKLTVYTLGVLAFTAVMFVLVPRPFLSIPGLTAAVGQAGGFARLEQRIRYSDMAGMAGRHRIAFKVVVEQGTLPETPYWRGGVLDRFDGKEWTASGVRGMGRLIKWSTRETLVMRIIPFRLQSKIVYVTGLPVAATGRMDRPLLRTADGGVVVDSPFLFADSYNVWTVNRPVPVSRLDRPKVDTRGITPGIRALGERWTARLTSPRDKAAALVSRLRRDYTYRLQPPLAPEGANPIESFLFESRTGNCEQFSGALCLLLRAAGIPARIVEGFAGVEKTDIPSEYVVRFARAHAWAEAHLGGEHWTELDASPAIGADAVGNPVWRWLTDFYDNLEHLWVKQVVYFDRSDQAEIFRGLKRILTGQVSLPRSFTSQWGTYLKAALAGAAGLVAAALVLLLVRKRRADFPGIYLSTMKKLSRTGILSSVHPWHEQNSEEIIRKHPGAGSALAEFMDIYLRGRFAEGQPVSIQDLQRARAALLRSVAATRAR